MKRPSKQPFKGRPVWVARGPDAGQYELYTQDPKIVLCGCDVPDCDVYKVTNLKAELVGTFCQEFFERYTGIYLARREYCRVVFNTSLLNEPKTAKRSNKII